MCIYGGKKGDVHCIVLQLYTVNSLVSTFTILQIKSEQEGESCCAPANGSIKRIFFRF